MKSSLIKAIAFLLLLATQDLEAQSGQKNILPGWAFGGFERPSGVNPVITPLSATRFLDPMTHRTVAWEANYTFNPAAAVKGNKVVVLYRAEDKTGTIIGTRTSRIGYAESTDGLKFKRDSKPVLYPAEDAAKAYEWPGGCEDPRVAVTMSGQYVMFYTEWNRKVPRLGVATSQDLKLWTKHGPIFKKAFGGKFYNRPHKSASILTAVVNGRQVITKIHGVYWMYWGEEHVYAATSVNLTDWTPVLDKHYELKQLMSPRRGYFDSDLTECGPPAIKTAKGIILFYNGKNGSGNSRDKRYATGSYCAGQALFDKNHPEKLLHRLDKPFLRPEAPFEKSGQYVAGTVFIEGMAYFKTKWYLYYGCADSRVAVAVYDPNNPVAPDQ